MKAKMKAILCILCLLLFLPLTPTAQAEEAEDQQHEYHFVVIYDVSGSMSDVDPDMLIRNMVALFLDKIPAAMYPIKMAVLPFSDACPAMGTLNPPQSARWWEFGGYDDVECAELKRLLGTLEYTNGYTDIGQALQAGNAMLSEMRQHAEICTQTVLFMTDGLPDLVVQDDIESTFNRICYSYDTAMAAAETFPTDAHFLGIVPNETARNAALKYNETQTEIVEYCGKAVLEGYGEKLIEVSRCVHNFCRILRERQGESLVRPAEVVEVNWLSQDVSEQVSYVYQDFFDQEFHTNSVKRANVDITNGEYFSVPETVSEINITIIPVARSVEEKKRFVQECAQTLKISNEDGDCQPFLTDSQTAVTARLVNPLAGMYEIRCEDISPVELIFCAYGDLIIQASQLEVQGKVGDPITFEGEILNGVQRNLTSKSNSYITAYIKDDENQYEVDCKDGLWKVSFTPTAAETRLISLVVEFNDTDSDSQVEGVSHFQSELTLKAVVSDVTPEPIADPIPSEKLATPSPSPVPPDELSLWEWICSAWRSYWPYVLALAFLLVTAFFVISNMRKRRFIVIISGGRKKKIRVKKSSELFVSVPSVPGLSIQWNGGENWRYLYNGAGPFPVVDNTIDIT